MKIIAGGSYGSVCSRSGLSPWALGITGGSSGRNSYSIPNFVPDYSNPSSLRSSENLDNRSSDESSWGFDFDSVDYDKCNQIAFGVAGAVACAGPEFVAPAYVAVYAISAAYQAFY